MQTAIHTARPRSWSDEACALASLAGPIVLTNLGQVAIQTTDVILIGWLGPEALAASTLGVATMFVLLIFGIGLVTATAPMIAHELGRRRNAVRDPRRTVRQGFWAALAFGAPAGLLLWQIAPILRLLGQDPELIVAAEPYVRAALWGFVPALWFIVLRNFISALERPRAGMVIMLIGIAFNALADYALIFGAFEMPALGLLGAGIATALTNLFLFVGLLAFIQIDRRFRRYRLLGRFWRADWSRFREILRIGVPIGIALTLEVGLFAGAAFLMGLIGTAELAAHQIALQCAAVSFMVPLGLSQAATVRVGLAAGRGDPAGVLRAGLLALALGTVFMLGAATVMWTVPETIVGIFLDLDEPSSAPVIELAVTFLAIAAAFQIFDGGQVIGAGALRGLKDTKWPMVYAGLSYWVLGLGSALALGFGLGLGGVGIWLGLLVGLVVAAALLNARFVLMQGRMAPRPAGLRAPAGIAV